MSLREKVRFRFAFLKKVRFRVSRVAREELESSESTKQESRDSIPSHRMKLLKLPFRSNGEGYSSFR